MLADFNGGLQKFSVMRSVTLCVFKKQKLSVFYLLYFNCTRRACCLENLMFWEILMAGCCRGLTGFNKLVLSTYNAVTTPYTDLSSLIHTVRFVSYSKFWRYWVGVNTVFTIWQANFVSTPPSKFKFKLYDTCMVNFARFKT